MQTSPYPFTTQDGTVAFFPIAENWQIDNWHINCNHQVPKTEFFTAV